MGRIYILYVFVERIYILYLFVGRIYMLVGICWKNILYYPLGGWKDGQEESYGLPLPLGLFFLLKCRVKLEELS